ncbi:MAG: hypothetical protein ACE145_18535 [Terriglobia bacterium]
MAWIIGVSALVILGAVLRSILRLDSPSPHANGLAPLGPERDALYQPVAQEIETQITILGISLNDAFDERSSGNHEIAWRLVRLSASEWDRLAEILTLLSGAMAEAMSSARVAGPNRLLGSSHFKSRVMIDYVRTYELLEQLVFRTRLRSQLQLRMLRRTVEMLSAEFRRAYRYADRTEDRPQELWDRLDVYFHDLDLISKEILLAFRGLLQELPHPALPALASSLKGLVQRGVRSPSVPADA